MGCHFRRVAPVCGIDARHIPAAAWDGMLAVFSRAGSSNPPPRSLFCPDIVGAYKGVIRLAHLHLKPTWDLCFNTKLLRNFLDNSRTGSHSPPDAITFSSYLGLLGFSFSF